MELEGSIHNQEGQQEYDAVRRERIEELGIRLMVLKNQELVEELESTLARILDALTPGPLSQASKPAL